MLNTNNIKNICPNLADVFMDVELSSEQTKNYQNYIDTNKKILGSFYEYLGLLHDSNINGIDLKNNKAVIHLNDFSFLQFAYALNCLQSQKFKPNNFKFPLTLLFNDISFLRFYKVNYKGKLNRLKTLKFNSLKEYLYDEIIEIKSNSIFIGFVFWQRKNSGSGNHVLCLLKCESVQVEEDFKNQFYHYFNNDFAPLFNEFVRRKKNREYLGDYTICFNFIRQWMDENKNITSART